MISVTMPGIPVRWDGTRRPAYLPLREVAAHPLALEHGDALPPQILFGRRFGRFVSVPSTPRAGDVLAPGSCRPAAVAARAFPVPPIPVCLAGEAVAYLLTVIGLMLPTPPARFLETR